LYIRMYSFLIVFFFDILKVNAPPQEL
jgi:hypothetical protein